METRCDSIDISQLKEIALGINSGPVSTMSTSRSFAYAGALLTPSSLQALRATNTTASCRSSELQATANLFTVNPARHTDAIARQRQWQDQQWVRHDASIRSASQIYAPNTMSDPSRAKVQSNSTPSEGDTQPASQWVYDTKEQASVKSTFAHSRLEGDTGHIDLLNGFEQEISVRDDNGLSEGDIDDEDVELVSQDIRAEPYPETMRFQQPKTPHAQSTKRKLSDREDTVPIETPRLPNNPFAGLGAAEMMRPSQIFQATQAQTSPHILHSDSVYERPSPNVNDVFNDLGRPYTTGSLTSPVMNMARRSPIVRAVPEPQETYISIKASQEARERQLQQMRMKQADFSDDDFGLPTHVQSHRVFGEDHDGRNVETHSTSRIRLPRPFQHPKSKAISFSRDSKAARKSGRRASEVVVISDDAVAGGSEGNVTEDETEREEEKEEGKDHDGEIDELAEDNKENVEVPMTVSRSNRAQIITSQASPSRDHVRRRIRTPGARSATQIRGSPNTTKSPARQVGLENGTPPYAVRDSQSSQRNSKARPAGPVASVRHSSPDSRHIISQSQPSQKSRSPFLSSSIPRKATMGEDVVNQLPNSSPLGFKRLEVDPSKINHIRTEVSVDAKERDEQTTDRSMGSGSVVPSSGKPHSEKSPVSTEKFEVMTGKATCKPLIANQASSQTGLTISATATNGQIIPNSSQDLSSSGPVLPSITSALSNEVPNRQSLGTAIYETAQEQMITSPLRDAARKLQVRSQASHVSSPTKNLRRRTLGEIAADPSPPDPVQDVDFSDFGLLSKEDVDFQNIVQRPSLMGPASRRRQEPASPRRQARNSTLWKGPLSDPPSDYLGTPKAPAYSQLSAPADVQINEAPSSSPLSTPPASQHTRVLSPAITKDVLDTSMAPHVAPSKDEPVRPRVQTPSAPHLPKMPSVPRPSTQLYGRPLAAEIVTSPPSHSVNYHTSPPQAKPSADAQSTVIAPDRVFAHFNGKQSAFYTATCVGVLLGEDPRYSIRYDDGAEDTISAVGIKRLELRPGDVVKIDLPSYRAKNFVVVGMQAKQNLEDPAILARRRKANPDDKSAWPEIDIHGYEKVLLSPKQNDSAGGNYVSSEQIAVGLYHLYLTPAMWTKIKDREYTHVQRKGKALGGLQTPSECPSTPTSPASRAKRGKPGSLAQSILTNGQNRTLFHNMVFTLTNIHQVTDLEHTKSLILNHGGRVLEHGFDSLFHVPIIHRTSSPKKSDADREFHLTRPAQSLGFTCLIADKYCRRAKYIQALALGIPCLASRWVNDCVSKQRILPWSAYLLPAGESTFLGGAARSRVLPSVSAETATLSSTVQQRPRMLDGTSILLIMSKAEEEIMRQHPLLTFALGPARVARALNIEAAAKAVAEAQAVGETWDWVFSYDREREVERALFGSAAKKRKSRDGDGEGLERRTKVIGNEFVVQSLILGQLVDV